MYWLKKIWSPELFQGGNKTKDYFEGWYYKLISADYENIFAVIPGIALGHSLEEAHAFVQVINGKTGRTSYFTYSFASFAYDKLQFGITIGQNRFSRDAITLDLDQPDLRISGELKFNNIVAYPKSFLNPGIMGPYSFFPFMECYHGIINIRHNISGVLNINDTEVDFTKGEGYLEKDYGKSFPSDWIWIQSNHFEAPGTCFMFSLARIPWLGSSFVGMICFLLHNGQLYRFATYNRAHLDKISLQNKVLEVRISRQEYQLAFKATGTTGGFLKAPKNGLMSRVIEESITASVEVVLSQGQEIIFTGRSNHSGMELSDGAEQLIK